MEQRTRNGRLTKDLNGKAVGMSRIFQAYKEVDS
jgi:hypothetical protein